MCVWGPIIHRLLGVSDSKKRLLGTGRPVFVLCRVWGPLGVGMISIRTGLTVGSHLARSSFLLLLRGASGQGHFSVPISHDRNLKGLLASWVSPSCLAVWVCTGAFFHLEGLSCGWETSGALAPREGCFVFSWFATESTFALSLKKLPRPVSSPTGDNGLHFRPLLSVAQKCPWF